MHALVLPLPETYVEEDHGDAGLMISNNGQEYMLQIVFNVQETEACGDPWCPCRWPPILRHEEGPRQGKALVPIITAHGLYAEHNNKLVLTEL